MTSTLIVVGWFLCSSCKGKKTGWIPESFLKKYVDDSLELGDIADQPKDTGKTKHCNAYMHYITGIWSTFNVLIHSSQEKI